jgi:hypothetical protein
MTCSAGLVKAAEPMDHSKMDHSKMDQGEQNADEHAQHSAMMDQKGYRIKEASLPMSPSNFLRDMVFFLFSIIANLKSEIVFPAFYFKSVTLTRLRPDHLTVEFIHQPGIPEQVIFALPAYGHFTDACMGLDHEWPHTLWVLRHGTEISGETPVDLFE